MSTNATTLNRQGAGIIPELWSLNLNKKLDNSGVGMKIVNRIYEKEVKEFGDTIHIGELGDVTVSDYSENETSGGVTYQRVSATSQTLKLDQSKAFGIFLSDITQKQSSQKDLQAKFERRAKTAIDLVKDTFILTSFADIPAENVKGSAQSPIVLTKNNVYSVFSWLSMKLKENNAIETIGDTVAKDNNPKEALPYVVINPRVESILRQSPDFIHATNAGDKVLRTGSIGEIAGLDVLVSTNLPTTNNVVNIMAGINDAIAFAGNVSHVEKIRDEKFFGDNVRGLYVYGKKTVLPNALAGAVVSVEAADTIEEAASNDETTSNG